MAGPVAIVAALLLLPALICIGTALLAAVLGWSVKTSVEQANEGSELLDLNR
jgi:hypothetical protein